MALAFTASRSAIHWLFLTPLRRSKPPTHGPQTTGMTTGDPPANPGTGVIAPSAAGDRSHSLPTVRSAGSNRPTYPAINNPEIVLPSRQTL